jgi:broad specificity phosphatase PhoE
MRALAPRFMPPPVLYYVRHGLTDWNAAGRLQGRHDVPLTREGRAQAVRCAEILADLFAREGRSPAQYDYVSSPLRRARETMDVMREALGLAADDYRVDARLAELSFGEWEGLTYAEVMMRDKHIVDRREGDKWHFLPPGGESYQQVAVRVGAWYAAAERDTVVAAHGGTARALLAVLGIVPPEQAAHHSIDHGVVYVFTGRGLARYE